MARSSVRQVHAIISGALDTATRWDWIPSNPAAVAKKPKQQAPQPTPPSPSQTARIAARAWESDLNWGMPVWLVMVTDGRRGELLALRWFDVDLDAGVLEVRRNYVQRSGKGQEKDTKSHQMRRIALDPETVEVFTLHRRAYDDQVAQLDLPADDSAFVFSYVADHSRPCNPDAVTHRYSYRHSREMR